MQREATLNLMRVTALSMEQEEWRQELVDTEKGLQV